VADHVSAPARSRREQLKNFGGDVSGTDETIIYSPSESELAYFAEEARKDEERRQHEAEGLRKLAARFAADPSAAGRCARILARLASDSSSYWDARDVVRERQVRHMGTFDESTTDGDLEAMCGAGLLEAEERNDGDEDAPPTTFWGAYAVRRDDLEEMLMLGTERWLAQKIAAASREPAAEAPAPGAMRPETRRRIEEAVRIAPVLTGTRPAATYIERAEDALFLARSPRAAPEQAAEFVANAIAYLVRRLELEAPKDEPR
jgi:hypothetical protein